MKAFLKGIPVVKNKRFGKDGKTAYYSVGITQDGDLIEFSTTEAVYDDAKLYLPSSFELTLTKGEYLGKVYERKTITAIVSTK